MARKINRYRINVYILTGENILTFSLLIWISFIGQFIHPVGGEEIPLSLFKPAASITLSKYKKIWSNIQVMTYQLNELIPKIRKISDEFSISIRSYGGCGVKIQTSQFLQVVYAVYALIICYN